MTRIHDATTLDQITCAIRNAALQIVQSSDELRPVGQITVAVRTLLEAAEPNLFDQLEGLIVEQAFRHCGGNQIRAALALGMSRNSFRTLLKKHGHLNKRSEAEASAAL